MSAWMTAAETADYMRRSREQVYKLAQHGKLPAFKPDGKLIFRTADVDKYLTRVRA